MKQVLFATTALIATAGIASAEIALSGSAQMGVIGGDFVRSDDLRDEFDNVIVNPAGNADDAQFFTDIDVTFTLSGATETGLTFGASIDLDESDGDPSGAFDGTDQGGESIFVSGAFGLLTMGDTDGAFDFAMQEAAIGSTIGDVHTSHSGYNGNSGLDGNGASDGQVARYQYALQDFTLAASFEIDDRGTDIDGEFDGDNIYGIGGTYTGEFGQFTVGVGLGYQQADDANVIGGSLDMRAGGFQAILNYSEYDDVLNDQDSHYAIALGYDINEFTLGFNYGVNEFDDGTEADGYGIAVVYDLGGAELQLGYGDGEDQNGREADGYSFGISMAF